MLVFAVETSCDETSICIMESNKKIHSHMIYSQEIHKKHGGVVPELASRAHLEILQKLYLDCFKKSKISINDIDVFSATCGPGLIGGLLVGSIFTKSLAIGSKKPFLPINHLEAHITSTSYNNEIKYPHLIMLLTGGHTQIYLMQNKNNIKLLGETIDDAVGEAFDKVGKLLNLGYPGGPEIEKRAAYGNKNTYQLPIPLASSKNLDFSFSGIKTFVNILTKKNSLTKKFVNDLSASFQKNIEDILSIKLQNALDSFKNKPINIKNVSIVGGVANNNYIKKSLTKITKKNNIEIFFPINEMISDNAAMIAWNCICKYDESLLDLNFKANPRLAI